MNQPATNVIPLPSGTEDANRRQAPHNEQLEMALLAAMLHNNRALEYVSEFLKPEHFSSKFHGQIYSDILRMVERGMIADPVTLAPIFASYEWVKAGQVPANYLIELATHLVAVINTADYGKQIFDLYLRRELIELGTETVNAAFVHEIEPDGKAQIEAAEQKLFELASSGMIEGGFQNFKTAMRGSLNMASAALTREGGLGGIATGLKAFDKLLGGLKKSDLVIIAGRPSMGKTALVTNIAFNIASTIGEEDKPNLVGFFSLEMSAEQLSTRILAEQMGISSDKIQRGELQAHEFESLTDIVANLEQLPLFIDDTPALSVSGLRTRARRLARQNKGNLALIVVDYLQLLQGSKTENRVQEISEITRGLKALAKELSVPVVALSQLSREVEKRDDKRPQLADLRDSGTIEQDADVVAFVYREEYYLDRSEPSSSDTVKYEKWQAARARAHNRAEIIIAKQRHGPIGKVELNFEGATTRFSDIESKEDYHYGG
ncbi:MAG: replicative DNA helicase [Candidatus Pacebacteria bacterium]|nr:replicative DNA helicase [Candidatus Paceibacterota bacterium]